MENVKKELEQLGAGKLGKLKNIQPQIQSVPDGYFDGLNETVFAKLKGEAAPLVNPVVAKPALTSVRGGAWFRWAAAALLVGIAATGWWFIQKSTPQSVFVASTDISSEDAEAYLLENLELVETGELAVLDLDLSSPLHEPVIKGNEPKANQITITPTRTELELLEELTDEDLEDLL